MNKGRWEVKNKGLFENYKSPDEYGRMYAIEKVVKEDWDELWHAYYWHQDTYDIRKDYLTYIRVPKEVGLELFANLI